MNADGFSLDDHRKPLLDENKLGVNPSQKLNSEEHIKNNLPDILLRWKEREGKEHKRSKKEQSFTVKKDKIVASGYSLNLNSYKEIEHEYVEHVPPIQLVSELKILEKEINKELQEIEELL
jgi:type I restriction enzyme M protein